MLGQSLSHSFITAYFSDFRAVNGDVNFGLNFEERTRKLTFNLEGGLRAAPGARLGTLGGAMQPC